MKKGLRGGGVHSKRLGSRGFANPIAAIFLGIATFFSSIFAGASGLFVSHAPPPKQSADIVQSAPLKTTSFQDAGFATSSIQNTPVAAPLATGFLPTANPGSGAVLGASTPPVAFTYSLSLGSVGTEVSTLQESLKAQGFYTYPEITGYFGQVTMDAVIAFQKANGINPIGIVGPATQAKILALAMSTPTPSTSQTPAPATGTASDSFVTQSLFQKQIDSIFHNIALSQRIDQLSGVTLSNVSGLTDADIPDGITVSNYLLLTGGTLAGDLTVTGNFTVAGAQTLSGAITVPYVAATSTTIDSTFVRLTATYATTTNATSTNLFASVLTATNATTTNFFATTASSTNLFTSLFNAGGNTLVVTSAGKVGISTSTPWTKLSVVDTIGSAQFTLAYDQTRYSQLYVDASGDLTISAQGGNVRLPDYNLFVCSGGACPTPTVSISGTGNLQIENRLIAGSIEKTCATGYVWVPGSSKYGTNPGFCTMKYEARDAGGGVPASTPTGTPYVSISQVNARAQCEALGTGYHLMSDQEWMTIADQIAMLPINDLDADAGLQLANGHTDNAPGNSLSATAGSDPVVSGCNLMLNMEDASNAYSASSCEIRGTGSGGSTDADKGFYGTGQQWSASGYSSGGSNKAQLRTAVLTNGNVIWDFPGDVWEWTDAYIYSALASGAASTTSEMPDAGSWSSENWFDWTQITNFKSLSYIRPKVTTWSASSNGIGRIYLDHNAANDGSNYHAFLRGGYWYYGSDAGVFTLNLNSGPANTGTHIGFRCSR